MPRETLTAEKNIEAAVSLLDTDRLDGFNTRRLESASAAYGDRTCRRNGWCAIGNPENDRWTKLHLKRGRVAKVRISLYSNYVDVGPEAPDPRCRRSN